MDFCLFTSSACLEKEYVFCNLTKVFAKFCKMLITESISLQLCKLIFTIISNQKQRNSRHWQGEIYRVFSLAMHSSLYIKCLKMQISCRENTDLHLIKAKCRILQMQNSEMQNAECRILQMQNLG